MKCTVPPMGIDAWADYQLSTYIAKSSRTCAGCGKNGKPTWAWGPKSQDFCAVCWHKGMYERFQKANVQMKVNVEMKTPIPMETT
jgi:hypothetical protein